MDISQGAVGTDHLGQYPTVCSSTTSVESALVIGQSCLEHRRRIAVWILACDAGIVGVKVTSPRKDDVPIAHNTAPHAEAAGIASMAPSTIGGNVPVALVMVQCMMASR